MQDEKVYFDATRGPDESLEGQARRPVVGPALVETARQLATQTHGAQKDKAGNPYIDHPRRVAERLEAAGASAQAVAAGWLHDVLEDTPTTAADLAAVGIPTEVIDAVTAVTKPPRTTRHASGPRPWDSRSKKPIWRTTATRHAWPCWTKTPGSA